MMTATEKSLTVCAVALGIALLPFVAHVLVALVEGLR